jgi:endonuclease-3
MSRSLLSESEIDSIFMSLSKSDPEPKTELYFINHYTLLVAVVLSAQATDKGVNKATKSLFEQVKTPEDMLAFGEEKLKDAIKTIGLYRTKAKHIMALSALLCRHYHSQVPNDFKALQSLPGVGRKTANVILNCAFGVPTIAVDTHVFRVSRRLGLAQGDTPNQVEDELMAVIPEKWRQHAHHWLILHGRYCCEARKPRCEQCSCQQPCRFYQEHVKGC